MLFGWDGTKFAVINLTTGQVSSHATQPPGPGSALVSAGAGALLVAQSRSLCTVNTTSGVVTGCIPFSSNEDMNALTFVGTTLYGSYPISVTPKVTMLVTINSAIGGTTVVGTLPPSIDAIAGIPAQTTQTSLRSPQAVVAPAHVAARAPAEPTLRIGARSLALHDLLALGSRDAKDGERVRRIIPLASLAALGLGDRVKLVSAGGDTSVVAIHAAGLALTVNHRQELKLVDTREGFHQIFGAIVEIRGVKSR
jgi:hypothetical protein